MSTYSLLFYVDAIIIHAYIPLMVKLISVNNMDK